MSSKTATRCRHVKINGARCTMPSWKDNGLCFEHNYRWEQQLRRPAPTRQTFSPGIPFVWVEDEASVLHNLNLIAKALGDSEIDHRQAAVMTCVQRTCLRTLRQREERLQSEEEPEPIVADCVEEDGGQLLVPPDPPAAANPELAAEPAIEPVAEAANPIDSIPGSLDPVNPLFPTPTQEGGANPSTSHTYEICEKNLPDEPESLTSSENGSPGRAVQELALPIACYSRSSSVPAATGTAP